MVTKMKVGSRTRLRVTMKFATKLGTTQFGTQLDSEQADGWSQHLEQKLAKRQGAQQIDESQHRVSWDSRGSQIRRKMQTNHVRNRHGSVQNRGACNDGAAPMPAATVHVHQQNILTTSVTLHVSRVSALTIFVAHFDFWPLWRGTSPQHGLG